MPKNTRTISGSPSSHDDEYFILALSALSSHGLVFMHHDDLVIRSYGDGPLLLAVYDCIRGIRTTGSLEVAIADH